MIRFGFFGQKASKNREMIGLRLVKEVLMAEAFTPKMRNQLIERIEEQKEIKGRYS